MSNFAFLPQPFHELAEAAERAEGQIRNDPRAACFHARFALEAAVHWLYRHEQSLRVPYEHKLGALIYEPTFQNLLGQTLFAKVRLIHTLGNLAVHERKPVAERDALQAVKELHHLCYWLVRTYTPNTPRDGAAWRDDRIPYPAGDDVVPRAELEALEDKLAKQNAGALKQQQERDALDSKLQEVQQQLAQVRAEAEATPDSHDYTEAETRSWLIDVELKRAGWPLDQARDREYEVIGMPNNKGVGYADYVLWGDDGKPLAVVEAKRTTVDATTGRQQAKLYADCLENMHGQRPLIFYTNGYEHWLWDDTAYPPRRVAGFYGKAALTRLITRRDQCQPLDVARVKDDIAGRYYQKRAIGSIFDQFGQARRRALLVMATGTGKTRTAIALVDALQRAGWVKRALFLADRVSLVNQAANAFKTHLPEASPVNLVTEKYAESRVYVSTYPTMLNLINEVGGNAARFGVGHFDLVIIDEAHRSVYQKYGAIFRYFDSLLVGLTATPRDEVDRNTYDLFELEPGVPTDAYELDTAVKDGFLVPPRVQEVDLKFPREGIDYDSLSDKEKAEWESLDWGDDVDENGLPSEVNAAAINNWLFNRDTVDKVLQHLMQNGHRVEGGDRLAKTIVFARNHPHAKFIEERFNHHYPGYKGHFARIIDNYAKYPQSLLDAFSQADKPPHIAISVDMLDTGVDVPEVANLVFFKPVYSKIKFWQMIGRGTRLCPDLFGPDDDKTDFRIFDFCFNFDFFRENPDGIDTGGGASLATRLFRARVQLLAQVQADAELDPETTLRTTLALTLQEQVAALNSDNFIVREQLQAVEHFRDVGVWEPLSEADQHKLQDDVAPLPGPPEADDIESRLFDLSALRLQLALTQHDANTFERYRTRVVEMAALLLEKEAIPAVKAQLAYLTAMQESGFWEDITLDMLEDMRLRLRDLAPFLDKSKRKIVYTNFQDEVRGVREEAVVPMPKMTGAQYEKKIKDYLRNHQDHIVIRRLRSNQPLTGTDLEGLEQTLAEIGEDDGPTLLSELLERSEAPSLAWFVRSMVGMDRAAAQAAFSRFLNDRSLTAAQIRFVEMVIDQLTERGVMEAAALYEPPFSNLHAGGPEALFGSRDNVINGIFDTLQTMNSGLKQPAA